MTAFSAMELGVALLCAFLFVVHVVLWRLDREDKLQAALAVAMLGFALLNAAAAGGSIGAGRRLGWTIPWLALGIVAAPLGQVGSLLLTWRMLAVPIRRARQLILVATLLASGVASVHFVRFIVRNLHADPSPWFEDMGQGLGQIAGIAGTLVALTALVEAVSALRRGDRDGWLLLGPIVPIVGLSLFTVVERAGDGGPEVIGLIGLPLVLLSSFVFISRYARAIRRKEYAGGYRLIRRLAGGGMGELFLAARTGAGGFERPVALKRVLAEAGGIDPRALERLLAEARMAATLVHPNIVAVHDVGMLQGPRGEEGFGWFIAMEYLPGVDLGRVRNAALAQGFELPAEMVAEIGLQAARGLAHAHAAGIVHRDISPQNLMLTGDGTVKIVDFGIAMQNTAEAIDRHGYLIGKVSYLPPEQVRGQGVGPASDVYSLGVVLYELLTGVRPFRGANRIEIAERVLGGEHVPVAAIRPGMPLALADVVEKCLARDAGARYPTGVELARDLERVLDALPRGKPSEVVRELFPGGWGDAAPPIAVTAPERGAGDDVTTRRV